MTIQKPTNIDEKDKITRLKKGCTVTFQKVHNQYKDHIYAYLLRKTKSEEYAKEISQLTFIKLWQYGSNLSLTIGFDSQIFRITRTCMIDFLRQKAHEREMKLSIAKKEIAEADDDFSPLSKLAYDDLIKHLDYLPPTRKKVFHMSKVEGYSNKEIAGQMNISIKTVEDHMTKALKKLRASIIFRILLFLSSF